MTVLDRWLPFKFRRRSAEEKKSEVKPVSSSDQGQPSTQALWPMASMQPGMKDFFEHPFGEHRGSWLGDVDHWFGDFAPARFSPKIDVSDEEQTLKITAELPGMSKDDVELSVENGLLTIRGEKRHEDETQEKGVYRTERYYGYVHRTLPIPEDVDQEQGDATFEKGVLTVRFPKLRPKENGSKRIAIKA